MIDQKSVVIGLAVSVILVLALGATVSSVLGQFLAVLIGTTVTGYLASRNNQLTVVETSLHGILVGIFTGIVQILIIYIRTGFSNKIVGVLITDALVIIGAYIIIGAFGGIVGMLIQLRSAKSNVQIEEQE